jgi:hypothetical protein
MKIALLLRGHYHTFEKVLDSWKAALDGCEYTCFFHTWSTVDSTTELWCKNYSESVNLLSDQINILKSWDPNLEIEIQEFSKEELIDIYATAPHKTYEYKFLSFKNTLNRIDKNKFDIIIVGRYDLILNNISFKDLVINENELLLGGRKDNRFVHNLATSDALFAFRADEKDKFNEKPLDLIERKYRYSEECYNDFFYKSFNSVCHKWNQNTDFDIQR